jgi:hypothetical protein
MDRGCRGALYSCGRDLAVIPGSQASLILSIYENIWPKANCGLLSLPLSAASNLFMLLLLVVVSPVIGKDSRVLQAL